MGYFDNCKSMDDLNKERSAIIIEINAEYNKKKAELSKVVQNFKRILFTTPEDIKLKELPTFGAFAIAGKTQNVTDIKISEEGSIWLNY